MSYGSDELNDYLVANDLSMDDVKDEDGNINLPVSAETQNQETAIWVAGNASITNEQLSEALKSQIAASGDHSWEDNLGLVMMRSTADIGKKVWIRVRGQQERWAGPYGVIKAAHPQEWYQWRKEKKVIEVSPEVGSQLQIGDKTKMVEVFWGNEPPDQGAGEADSSLPAVLGFDPSGGISFGIPAGMSGNRLPGLSQMPPGASMPFMTSSTGLSQGQINEGLAGRTDMDVGNDPVGSAVSDARNARAAWITDTVDPSIRARNERFNWDPSRGTPYVRGRWQYGKPQPPKPPLPPSLGYEPFFASYEEGIVGDLNMLYELQMAGLPQSAIEEYAKANNLSFDAAVRQLHEQVRVEDRWPTDLPWFAHMQESGVFGYKLDSETGEMLPEAGDLADAARAIGIDLEAIGLENLLYKATEKGGEFGEGSFAHYQADYNVGWTSLGFNEWSAERMSTEEMVSEADMGYGEDAYGWYYMYPQGTVTYDQEAASKWFAGEPDTYPDTAVTTSASSTLEGLPMIQEVYDIQQYGYPAPTTTYDERFFDPTPAEGFESVAQLFEATYGVGQGYAKWVEEAQQAGLDVSSVVQHTAPEGTDISPPAQTPSSQPQTRAQKIEEDRGPMTSEEFARHYGYKEEYQPEGPEDVAETVGGTAADLGMTEEEYEAAYGWRWK